MQFGEQWLRSWLDLEWDTARLSQELTMAGLEVESWRFMGAHCAGVVVAEIVSVIRHPQADRLHVVQVRCGEAESRQIVCGAKNLRPGMRVPLALPGTRLPGGVIAEAQVRQVLSRGMLCGADELGLADTAEGLLELPEHAVPGQDLLEVLNLHDAIVELGITPNRGDCLSIRGLAREIAALSGCALLEQKNVAAWACESQVPALEVQISSAACGRYLARRIVNINRQARTPEWMRQRLERCGLRCIHPVVDCTNYVMLELGQPLHAFAADRVKGGLQIRQAAAGELLVGLQGQALSLDERYLVIADTVNVLALAGIMGGADAAVSAETDSIILESAWFDPRAIAGKARSLGLSTESSHRFERGVDPQLTAEAMEYATALIVQITHGQAGELVHIHNVEQLPQRPLINLPLSLVQQLLGLPLEATTVAMLLERLQMQVSPVEGGWLVQAPSWRFDITEPVDLVEEVARLYGYNRLPSHRPLTHMHLGAAPDHETPWNVLLDTLLDQGFQEVMTYSFIDRDTQAIFDPEITPMTLANPMSGEMAVMRTCLWPGLLKVVKFNQNRQQERLRLFESGLRFRADAQGLQQELCLAGAMTGTRQAPGWQQSMPQARVSCDFFDVKGVVETLCAGADYQPLACAGLHPGQSAVIIKEGREIGRLGRLHPEAEAVIGVQGPVWLFELAVSALIQGRKPAARLLSRFPAVRRDLAVVVPQALAVAEVLRSVQDWAGRFLQHVELFDVYSGTGVPEDHKSLAISMTWQSLEETLSDAVIQQWTQAVLQGLGERFGAILRT